MRLRFAAALSAVLFSSLIAFAPATAVAQKPIVIVTMSNLDELFGDFGYMAEALSFGQFGTMGTMMAGQYTAGMDTTKPIGIVVTNDDGEMKPLAMLPMKDLDQFLGGLEGQIGEPKDAGDGVLELAGPVPVYLKEQGGWAFVTQNSDDLQKLPADPMKMIGAVAGKYDISVRAFVQNIPEEYREMAIAQIREGVEMQMDNMPESEETDAQKKMVEGAIKQWEDLFEGMDQVTLGIGIEPQSKKIVMDSNVTSVPGTKLARQMDLLNDLKSRFGGFLMKDAAVTLHGVNKMLPEDVESTVATVDAAMPQLMKSIDESDDLDDSQKSALTKIAGTLIESLRDTIKTGEVDMGMSLFLDKTFAMVGGMSVADGAKVESALSEAGAALTAEAAKANKADAIKIEESVDQHAGVRMHRLTIKTDDADEEARQILGDKLEVTFGIADKSIYLAAGEKGMEYLRKAIDASKGAQGESVLPMRMRISVAEIMKFAKQFEDDEIMAAVVDELEKVGDDQGYVMMVSKPIPKGAQYRLEIREGVLKAIGRGIEAGQGQGAGAEF